MAAFRSLRIAVILLIVASGTIAMSRTASAACTSPDGMAGAITWNGTDSVIWCNGTSWFALKNSGAVGSTGQLQFNNGSNAFAADSALIWDNTNKRLGVGTASPVAALHVMNATYPPALIERTTAITNSQRGALQLRTTSSGVMADKFGTGIDFYGDDSGGTAYQFGTILSYRSAGANNSGSMVFRTFNVGAGVDAVTIRETGNVGIGTTTPQATLDVNGGVKVGNNAGGCSSTNNGEIKYVSGSSPPYNYCNGSAWVPFESSGFVPAYAKFTVAQVSPALYHVCTLKSTGALWCWGYNGYDELGDGTTTNRFAPTQAVGAFVGPWSSISVSVYNTCGIKSADGSGWCWGYNAYGQVGDGTTTNRTSAPVQLSGTWIQLATGGINSSDGTINTGYYTCGVKSDHTGWCWGGNGTGNLGDGTTTQQNSPEQIAGSWLGIWMAPYDSAHTCGIQTDNSLWCWGYNGYGQLGNGATTSSLTPVQVSGSWSKVVLGERNTCGIKNRQHPLVLGLQ